MRLFIDPRRKISKIDNKIYGHFLEHFHRIIYSGIYDPDNPLSDARGLRQDVLDALKDIHVPLIRWPGGCFASDYHWQYGIGKKRIAVYDKAWRVTEANAFGTNEFIDLCRKLGAEPYICTNAGTGTSEEMSNWVEYCNLDKGGYWSTKRIESGQREPFHVHYWSIGNENYSDWEMGSKSADEWSRYVLESAKMMIRTDPTIELSAAALPDIDWDLGLLQTCSKRIQWVSVHKYWDEIYNTNDVADYSKVMSYTTDLEAPVRRIRGILNALGLESSISVAFDEWNLRGWYHPNMFTDYQGRTPEEYLDPRNQNDNNSLYTLADAIFTGCVLNMFIRNSDLVKMACYSPSVNVRGLIYTWKDGIVKRGQYYIFKLFTEYMGDRYIESYNIDVLPALYETHRNDSNDAANEQLSGQSSNSFNVRAEDDTKVDNAQQPIDALDFAATSFTGQNVLAISMINKLPDESLPVSVELPENIVPISQCLYSVTGDGVDSYNDIGQEKIQLHLNKPEKYTSQVVIPPASVNIVQIHYTPKA